MNNELPKLNVLFVDRPLSSNEHPVKDVFNRFANEVDIVFFSQEKENDSCLIEAVILNCSSSTESEMKDMFPEARFEDDDEFYTSFEIDGIASDVFLSLLANNFEVLLKLLSAEKPVRKAVAS